MKKLFNVILICFMALSIALTQSKNEFEKRFQEIHKAWFEGLLAESPQAIDQILSDDVTLGFPGGNVVSKQEFIDYLKNGTLFYDSAYHESSNLRIYGNTGVINGKSNLTYRLKMPDGKFSNGHEKLPTLQFIS